MKRVVVRYRVKPDRVAENERHIVAVYEQLHRERPADLRYAAFKLQDGVSFMHVALIDGPNDPLRELSAFQAFTAGIRDRCDEPPVAVEISEVGSYGFGG